jgi:predicted flap endonuclease-1-like 5' DNA nuclease
MMSMLENLKGADCRRNCWVASAAVGLVVLLLVLVLFGTTFLAALFWGIVVALLLGTILTAKLCRGAVHLPAEPAHTAVAPAPPPPPVPAAVPAPAAAPGAAKPAAPEPVAKQAEKKPAAEPSGQAKPQTLKAPRAGGADDLKKIKGVGPKLEKLLNGMGFYHFDQIAGWTEAEVAWVDANLEGFKGRVSRDGWIEQAKTLAAGADTEFSRRVGKGEVY